MNRGRNVATNRPVLRVVCGLRRGVCRGSLASGQAGRATGGELCALSHVGAVVCGGFAYVDGDEFFAGEMAAEDAFGGRALGGDSAEPGVVEHV